MSIDPADLVRVLLILLTIVSVASILFYQLLTGVPPMPSRDIERQYALQLLAEADLKSNSGVIYELGSGWGGLALDLARAYPDHQVIGMELSLLPYWYSRIRCRKHKNIRIVRQDFLTADLSDAAAVVCYLMMGPMPKLSARLSETLQKGVPVVSLAFWFRDRSPDKSLGEAGPGVALYFW